MNFAIVLKIIMLSDVQMFIPPKASKTEKGVYKRPITKIVMLLPPELDRTNLYSCKLNLSWPAVCWDSVNLYFLLMFVYIMVAELARQARGSSEPVLASLATVMH